MTSPMRLFLIDGMAQIYRAHFAMIKNPLVSVIVTTYNRKELLKETIDSILNQTFKNFELIVVDNFSDYDFSAHLESFNDDRIKTFQNQNNGVIAINRNFGIKQTKGKYIIYFIC